MERQKHSCLFIVVETIQLKFTNKDDKELFCIGCNYKYD